MKPGARIGIIMVVLTIVAAAFGGWFGVHYGLAHPTSRSNLDELLHDELNLTAAQNAKIEALETAFAARRKVLEDEMRAANGDLAAAIEDGHAYNDRARQAIDRFHDAMRTLQEETVKHVLAMRAVLTPGQAKAFDATIHRELVANPS